MDVSATPGMSEYEIVAKMESALASTLFHDGFETVQSASKDCYECEDCHRYLPDWESLKEHVYLKSHMLGHYRFRRTDFGKLEPDPMWTGPGEENLFERCSRRNNGKHKKIILVNPQQPYLLPIIDGAISIQLSKSTGLHQPINQNRFAFSKAKRRKSFLFWNASDSPQKTEELSDINLKRCYACKKTSTEGDTDPSDGHWYCDECWEEFEAFSTKGNKMPPPPTEPACTPARYTCPDCKTQFEMWTHCRQHLIETGHADINNTKGLQQRCMTKNAPFTKGNKV